MWSKSSSWGRPEWPYSQISPKGVLNREVPLCFSYTVILALLKTGACLIASLHVCICSCDSIDDEEWNLVTCFCRKPFAGRPMIECSSCNTWIHMFCANIPKDQVPEIYLCPRCQAASGSRPKRPRLVWTLVPSHFTHTSLSLFFFFILLCDVLNVSFPIQCTAPRSSWHVFLYAISNVLYVMTVMCDDHVD